MVTAVLNSRSPISDTSDSVQSQSFGNIEHILQDGTSTDGTLAVIQSLMDPRTAL
ncbi:glycosyltransferase [Tateyamaria sp.]|uniref:glycosyltransferase n=1 Tax=Tateyamaria sp. TaxID=1929288 RepID=UPI0039B8B1DB